MSVEQSLLGQETEYPTQYAPHVLFPIARAESRQNYADLAGIQQGFDWWHVFEISWLDLNGKPLVAIGRLQIPATSPNLIESKSLKLYFNSYNFEKIATPEEFIARVEADLSKAAGDTVTLQLFDANELPTSTPQGVCLDELNPTKIEFHPNAELIQFAGDADEIIETQYYSNLLRSNCPVTNQPDWGTVFIRYQGKKPCENSLLNYIISYRQHNGFHEQCVEQIYADIWTMLQPTKLMVYAAYTRRGGLDINPCRASDPTWIAAPIRLARQ